MRRALSASLILATLTGAALLALAVLEGLAWVALLALGDQPVADPAGPYYAAQPWGAEFRAESESPALGSEYVPYVGWKMRPFAGRWIQVDATRERVTPGARCEPGAYVVFVIGGSSVWGTGVPDGLTLPAHLQRRLADRLTRPVCVHNLGNPGWVSTQGVVELMRRLQAGARPQLVIFNDGFNDVDVLGRDGVAQGTFHDRELAERYVEHGRRIALRELARTTHLFALFVRLRPVAVDDRHPPAGLDAPAIFRAYLANIEMVEGLGRAFSFEPAFFWQPMLWLKDAPLSDAEREYEQVNDPGPAALRLLRETSALVRQAASGRPHLHYLGNLLDQGPGVMFVDAVHPSPEGHDLTAQHMLRLLDGVLPRRAP